MALIQSNEIHIHLLRLGKEPSRGPIKDLLPGLSSDERTRFSLIGAETKRREYLWSRLLSRRLISVYLNMEMKDLRFSSGGKGKPFIEDSRLKFNLSHTDGLIACSLGWSEVGIDVEKVDVQERAHWKSLAKRYFSPDEYNYLISLPGGSQPLAFFRIFTMKEAFVKSVGLGLNYSLNKFSVPLPLAQRSRSGDWEFFSKNIGSGGYCLAHAASKPDDGFYRYRIYEWNEDTFQYNTPAMNDGQNKFALPSMLN